MDGDLPDRQGGKSSRTDLGRTNLTPQKATRQRVDDDGSEDASTAIEPEAGSDAAITDVAADGGSGDAAAIARASVEVAAVGTSSCELAQRDSSDQNTAQDGTLRASVSVARGWASCL